MSILGDMLGQLIGEGIVEGIKKLVRGKRSRPSGQGGQIPTRPSKRGKRRRRG